MTETTKPKIRRDADELNVLKHQIRELLRRDKTLNSFAIQEKLDLKTCTWAPAVIRRLTKEMIQAGEVKTTGQKRGTKYHWALDESIPQIKLEKA